MGIKQKFFALAGMIGVILAIISGLGYYTAYSNLETSIENVLGVTVREQGELFNGWMREKIMAAQGAANIQNLLSDRQDITRMREMMSVAAHDESVLEVYTGYEDGTYIGYKNGDVTKQIDPRTRDWYKNVKKAGKLVITDAYIDGVSKKLCVSVNVPVRDKAGRFIGSICEDVSLAALANQTQKVKYQGKGAGILIEKTTGKVLATAGTAKVMSSIKDDEGIGKHFEEMKEKGQGYFLTQKDGVDYVLAYTTVESTGWLLGIAVERDFVFAQANSLRLRYGILSVVGIIITVLACLKFSNQIVKTIIALTGHMAELSDGNLRMDDIEVDSKDELGQMADGFNTMSHNLKGLLSKVSDTAAQVAASSQQLTAGAQQSAEAATNVAQTIVDVAKGVERQLSSVDGAKKDVDTVFDDITKVTQQAEQAAQGSRQAQEAAERGGSLMRGAVDRMGGIEKSVMSSAQVVKKLGENSQQIGQIVETISSIADQTNLLALNAAIEAARAGEAGRGFSVVAEEVRKLAEQSQKATEEIKIRIETIQGDTEAAVIAMESGTREVQEGTAAINEVGTQFHEIVAMVGDIEQQIADINRAIKTVSEGTNSIVSAVEDINEVSRATSEHTQTISAAAEEQSASSQEIASASQALSTLATELQETMQKFKM